MGFVSVSRKRVGGAKLSPYEVRNGFMARLGKLGSKAALPAALVLALSGRVHADSTEVKELAKKRVSFLSPSVSVAAYADSTIGANGGYFAGAVPQGDSIFVFHQGKKPGEPTASNDVFKKESNTMQGCLVSRQRTSTA